MYIRINLIALSFNVIVLFSVVLPTKLLIYDLWHFQELSMIYELTCPATIHSPTFHGHIGLHRNVQWIDPETITECTLHHLNDVTEPDVLDSERSIIIAKDYIGDGNTFKAMDHLMADPVAMNHIQSRGCNHPIYRIINVKRSQDRHFDVLRGEHYHILKLHVVLPSSPMDYMATSHVYKHGIPLPVHGSHPPRRLLPAVDRNLPAEFSNCAEEEVIGDNDDAKAVTSELPPLNVASLFDHSTSYVQNIFSHFAEKFYKYFINDFDNDAEKTLLDWTKWCRKVVWKLKPADKATSSEIPISKFLNL